MLIMMGLTGWSVRPHKAYTLRVGSTHNYVLPSMAFSPGGGGGGGYLAQVWVPTVERTPKAVVVKAETEER